MAKLKIGILEIISYSVADGLVLQAYATHYRRHYASITPQAVAVWCRQLGHEVHYRTYYGQADPKSLLPESLDVLFLSSDTRSSALIYALAKIYRRKKTLTVVGGPHARSFPADCLRFFDHVVEHCDKTLIEDILRGDFDRHTRVTSGRILSDVPSVEERLPEILISTYKNNGRRAYLSNVPLLSSVGCPYRCDFCVDWNNPYVVLPPERLAEDLRFIAKHLPEVFVSFHDPNFGVNFDEVLGLLEALPEESRHRYLMQSSLSILRGPRLPRLKATKCEYVGPAVESWGAYSNKAGAGKKVGREKLEKLVEHFTELYEYVPGIQANFIFGTDVDQGDEPVELTREFIRRLPFVWPVFNIPIPFGGTPLQEEYLAEDRVLRAMPLSFYYVPNLATTLKNYSPRECYDRLIEMQGLLVSGKMLRRRLASTPSLGWKGVHLLRTLAGRTELAEMRRIREQLESDLEFRAFHNGKSDKLPAYYRQRHAEMLGPYAELISESDMRPVLDPPPEPIGATPRPADLPIPAHRSAADLTSHAGVVH